MRETVTAPAAAARVLRMALVSLPGRPRVRSLLEHRPGVNLWRDLRREGKSRQGSARRYLAGRGGVGRDPHGGAQPADGAGPATGPPGRRTAAAVLRLADAPLRAGS